MINLIRHLFVRPVVRMVSNVARIDFDKWNRSYSEMRYYFEDSDGIQLSKEFPDVHGIGIEHTGSVDNEYVFKPTAITLYVGTHVRNSGQTLELTKTEQKYLKNLLLQQYATVEKRSALRKKAHQNQLAYDMAKSLKKHVK
jgi:hypothetical protein